MSPPLPPLVDHAEVVRRLDGGRRCAPDLFTLEKIGESIEGRSINYVRAGTGPLSVLLWSQMHGDETDSDVGALRPLRVPRRHRDEPMPSRGSCRG